jgi:hypothetical protein
MVGELELELERAVPRSPAKFAVGRPQTGRSVFLQDLVSLSVLSGRPDPCALPALHMPIHAPHQPHAAAGPRELFSSGGAQYCTESLSAAQRLSACGRRRGAFRPLDSAGARWCMLVCTLVHGAVVRCCRAAVIAATQVPTKVLGTR